MRSAVYEGVVVHVRHQPVRHRFAYRIALPLLDLDEVEEVCALHPLWSVERPNAVSYRRGDFLGGGSQPLSEAVRDLVEERLGDRPEGPIALLANLRTWGWLSNPIALYYCFDRMGQNVEAVVAEVSNTPWHERHTYVVGAPGEHRFDKRFHVSPFLEMDQHYRFRYSPPDERLTLQLGNEKGGRRILDAAMRLERHEVSRHALGRIIGAYPMMTMRISAGIYRQAFALWRAGVPFVPHPDRARPAEPDLRRRFLSPR